MPPWCDTLMDDCAARRSGCLRIIERVQSTSLVACLPAQYDHWDAGDLSAALIERVSDALRLTNRVGCCCSYVAAYRRREWPTKNTMVCVKYL